MSDAAPYRIFGIELSPYSVKVRSYFRYKGIPHTWVVRGASQMDEFRRYAKLPLIPLVVGADGTSLQDSTPIVEHMEALYPEPGIHPRDPVAAFVSALIEEYADEWGNKPMFHYRWTYEPDQRSAAERIARESMPDADAAALEGLADAVRARMVPRLSFVGSNAGTRETIEYLRGDKAEVILVDKPVAEYYLRENEAMTIRGSIGHPMDPDPLGVALRKVDRALQIAVEGAIKDMRADGSYDALLEEWFGRAD